MVPFCPFYFRVSLLKPNSKKKGTLIVMGPLRNPVLAGPEMDRPHQTSLIKAMNILPPPFLRLGCRARVGFGVEGF